MFALFLQVVLPYRKKLQVSSIQLSPIPGSQRKMQLSVLEHMVASDAEGQCKSMLSQGPCMLLVFP